MMRPVRGAILREVPGWLEIADLQIADPLPHEVIVRTAAAGLCHSDLHFMEGKWPASSLPLLAGHESAGVVEAVGSDVTYVVPGDHVITCLSVFCGQCEYCVTGRPHLCQSPDVRRSAHQPPRISEKGVAVAQFAQLGSFSELLLVHERAVVKIRNDMPLDRAALIGCGVATGVGAVFNGARVPPGATVAVIGCGGIGLNCVQGARLAGASRIIAIDRLDSKLELATEFGATHLVNASQGDPVSAVIEISEGGVEYSFEAIGLASTAEQAWRMLRRGGTATVIGMIPVGDVVTLDAVDFMAEKRIQGSNMGANRFRVDMPRYVELYMQGRLKLDELVSARIKLEDVNEGFKKLQGGDIARSVIIF